MTMVIPIVPTNIRIIDTRQCVCVVGIYPKFSDLCFAYHSYYVLWIGHVPLMTKNRTIQHLNMYRTMII